MKLIRKIVLFVGIVALIYLALAFTTLPFWGVHWLGTNRQGEAASSPQLIVMMGGSGMPSESNLIRSWYTARAALSFPESLVVIVMPGDPADSSSTPALIKKDLTTRGVSFSRILFENSGTNTRSQALECAQLFNTKAPVLLVTSPDHMLRSLLSFRKAGFEKITGLPTFENAAEADFTFRDDDLGSNPLLVPDVGSNTQLRYQVWTHLKYELLITREFMALTYYRLRGWI